MGAGAQEKRGLNPAAAQGLNGGGWIPGPAGDRGEESAPSGKYKKLQGSGCCGEEDGRVRCVESMLRGQSGCGASTSSADEALGHSWGDQRGRDSLKERPAGPRSLGGCPEHRSRSRRPPGNRSSQLVNALISDQSRMWMPTWALPNSYISHGTHPSHCMVTTSRD